MAEVIVLPKMGLTAGDGEVLRWLVNIGDRVTQGQEVVEIETYKATLAVESPADGVLRAAIDAGTTVPAGAVIGIVAEPDEPLDGLSLWSASGTEAEGSGSARAARTAPSRAAERGRRTSAPNRSTDGLRASPLARRMARELGIDLTTVRGSGPRNRITEKDIHAAAQPIAAPPIASGERRVPLTPMRRAIAALMTASAQIPQFTLEATASIGPDQRPPDVSHATVVIAACARTLREFPHINTSFDNDAVIEHGEINIGVAVALDQGLIVPVIHDADEKTLPQLDAERRRLHEAAQSSALGASDLLGGTFTVSNLGPLGIERFRALVLPPQAAILAVGAIRHDRLALSLSCDHRVLDGAPAALFLNKLVERLENLDWLKGSR
ncbi:MAG TPA: dihydrolipoamide acetyltransferase family protein [Solirubrobacteraceae bacterium]|nr:dihydrolipoamide acetyltransferase family protein [Solirubrobacteraceae bacterium]